MNVSRRLFFGALSAPLLYLAAGCTGADNPQIPNVAPPPPATEAQKAPAKGMPQGYGQGDAYQKAMERAANR
jgi:hypothetical protein